MSPSVESRSFRSPRSPTSLSAAWLELNCLEAVLELSSGIVAMIEKLELDMRLRMRARGAMPAAWEVELITCRRIHSKYSASPRAMVARPCRKACCASESKVATSPCRSKLATSVRRVERPGCIGGLGGGGGCEGGGCEDASLHSRLNPYDPPPSTTSAAIINRVATGPGMPVTGSISSAPSAVQPGCT